VPDNIDMDTVRKVATLENDLKHLTTSVEKLTEKVEELTGLLQQVKGARWILLGVLATVGIVGGFVGKFVTVTLPVR
jgi:hypothetical protein